MPINSRNKGAKFERDIAKILNGFKLEKLNNDTFCKKYVVLHWKQRLSSQLLRDVPT